MKVFIYTDRLFGDVKLVDTRIPEGVELDTEIIEEKIKKYNEDESQIYNVSMIEVNGDIEEAFKFLLGLSKYRRTYTFKNLYDKMDEVNCELEYFNEHLNEWYMRFMNMDEHVKEIKDEVDRFSLLDVGKEELTQKK